MRRLLKYTLGVLHRSPPEILAPPINKKWLIIAPHNDDEAIAIGGLLSLLSKTNAKVDVVFVTGNDKAPAGSIADVRWNEALEVAKLLEFTPIAWYLNDGQVSLEAAEFDDKLQQHIEGERPDIILCPFPTDQHQDHQSCSLRTGRVLKALNFEGEIWCYEIWSTIWPNTIIDISSVVTLKKNAINIYQSQVYAIPYDRAILGLNQYRGLLCGVEYGEAIYRCKIEEFSRLTKGLDRI